MICIFLQIWSDSTLEFPASLRFDQRTKDAQTLPISPLKGMREEYLLCIPPRDTALCNLVMFGTTAEQVKFEALNIFVD